MAEPVTIGGQTFIKTSDGWVDKKTKVLAPESLFTLLNSLTAESTTEYKKLRVRIDSSKPPVSLAGEEYVFDINQSRWINKKTRDAVNDSLQKVINGVLEKLEVEKASAAPAITTAMGTIGQAAKSSVKKPDGAKMPVNIKINSPIVSMIEKLATIDGYLKQRLDNQKKIAARNLAATKETAIEASPKDAQPVQEVKTEDASKDNTAAMATALLVGGLIAAQFEPVQEAFKSLVDGVKGVWNFVSGVAGSIADGLDAFTSSSSTSSTTSTNQVLPSSSNQNNLENSTPNTVETPAEGTPSEPNKSDATPVASTPSTPNEATPTQQSSVSTRLGRTIVGAAVGAAVAGPRGAIAGAAVGFLSTPKQSASPSSSTRTSPSSGAPATASPSGETTTPSTPTSTSSAPASGDATQQKSSETPDATKINGTNYDGLTMKNFAENTGGGPAAENTIKFAKIVQPGLGNMFARFTAFNDKFHQGITEYVSPHTKGIAFDLTVKDPSQAGSASNKIKELADKNKFKVSILNEYANPTAKSTGGHIHVTVHGPGVGSSVRGGSGMGEPGGDGAGALGAAASAVWDIGKGAIQSIGDIISAGLGPMAGRNITESLMQTAPNTAGEIATAAVSKNAKMAEAKTPAIDTGPAIKDPPNISKSTNTDFVQNIPTSSDAAGVDYYLTRMGFPKIEYHVPVQQVRYA